jgi:alpha-beta hydrolase superfamily lysophospholipase
MDMKKGICLLMTLFVSLGLYAQEPARKALMGAYGKFTDQGLVIDSIVQGSTYYKLGLVKGDTLTVIDRQDIKDAATYNKYVATIRSGNNVKVRYKHGAQYVEKMGQAIMRPYDEANDREIVYGWATIGKCTLRTIIRKPKGSNKMPAVLLIPGYNCGSVENYAQGYNGKLIDTWVKAGFAVVTIEKTGIGDSYGCTDCIDADLSTDIEVFDAGYRVMENLPYADKNNLFIWGHSMGGVIAPIIAQRHKPRAVIAFATVYRPWSEFLLEMHRAQAPLDGKTYAETEDFVRLMQKVYYEFFRLKRPPSELYENPEYKAIVASEMEYKPGEQHMWGRHWRFWQQLDSVDLARSWAAVDAKVLSVFGGADYIACSRVEHELIERTVNSTHPGNGTYMEIPDVDHLITRNPDWKSSHKHISDAVYREANFHQGFADKVTGWMKSVMVR